MSELQQDKLKIRLHRIEGQVRGIAKMLDEDRSAQDILMQLRAVRAALASVSGLFVAGHLDDQITEIIKTKR
ncbi:MAG: metal-sensitive transcriptional regulator [Pseudomonadales bacterium]